MSAPAPAAAVRVRVDVLSERESIGSLSGEWERLRADVSAAGGTRGPFLAPAWFAAYAAELPAGALRLLIARGDGQLRAVLPLMFERRAVAGIHARVLRSLSDDHSQRFDLLMKRGDNEAARALLAALSSDPSWDVLEMRDAPVEGSAVDTLLEAANRAGFPSGHWSAMSSPALSLPSSRADLYSRLNPRFCANLRRRRRRLEQEVGPIALERVRNAGGRMALERALDDAFRLEAAGWKGASGTAIAADWRLVQRYRRIAHAFAEQGALALAFLTVGGHRKAFHFALLEQGVYYLFKPGYDPALARYGPGHLLVQEVVEDLIEHGAHELDFLGDCDAWKREWTGDVRRHAWRYVFAPTPFGRALAWWKLRLAPRLKRVVRR